MLFDDSYKTIEAPAAGVFKDRGSKFLGFAYPVKTESEVKEIIHRLKSEHHGANHHCYAFRLGPGKSVFRFSDDREPTGSAGKPIYGVIQSNDLTDVLVVVVRYFGGTLLGVPGLINAYRSAAAAAVSASTLVNRTIMERYVLKFNYEVMNPVMEILKQAKAQVLTQDLGTDCTMVLEVPKTVSDDFISKIRNHHLLKNKCDIKVP